MDLIQDAIEYVRVLFRDNAGSHDASHTLRVYRNALAIAEREAACDRELVSIAALLHDADDHKLFHTQDHANARRFLEEHAVEPERIEQIIRTVSAVSFSRNRGRRPETPEGKIVQDADRLDAMGAVGVAKTFAYGGEQGRSLDASILHFHEKLLLLKDELNTETAKKLAEDRHAFLLAFLAEYAAETDEGSM